MRENHVNGSATLLYPLAYAGGAAMSLCGGVFAMASRATAPAGIAFALIGVGIVTVASIAQGIRVMGQRVDTTEDPSLPPHQPLSNSQG